MKHKCRVCGGEGFAAVPGRYEARELCPLCDGAGVVDDEPVPAYMAAIIAVLIVALVIGAATHASEIRAALAAFHP